MTIRRHNVLAREHSRYRQLHGVQYRICESMLPLNRRSDCLRHGYSYTTCYMRRCGGDWIIIAHSKQER